MQRVTLWSVGIAERLMVLDVLFDQYMCVVHETLSVSFYMKINIQQFNISEQ